MSKPPSWGELGLHLMEWGVWQNCVPLDRNTYCLDSVADKYTYTLCTRDSLIPAVNGNFSTLEIQVIFPATWEGEDCLYGLVKVPMHDSHHTVRLITGVEILSCRRCSRSRGEGADGKTKRLALLTPDKLTSDGASCSASGACWAEQLSVEPRTGRGKPQVCKQKHEQTNNQSRTAFDACLFFLT